MSDETQQITINARGQSRTTGSVVDLGIEIRFTEGEFETAMSLLAQVGATDLARRIIRSEMGDDE